MDGESLFWFVVMVFTVLFTVSYSSWRALCLEKYFFKIPTNSGSNFRPYITFVNEHLFITYFSIEQINLDWKTALTFPLFASCTLLAFFYYFHLFSSIFTLSLCFTSTFSLSFTIYPLLFPQSEAFYQFFLNDNICSIQNMRNRRFLSVMFISISILFLWLLTGAPILNNLMGISFCVMGISLIRIPNVKVGSIILLSLFVYDIFWVFYSKSFFGQNVMVAVAQKQATNPAASIASHISLDKFFTPFLQLPVKLIFGHSMIGLGDIVIPGLFIAYCLKFDLFIMKRSSLFELPIYHRINTKKLLLLREEQEQEQQQEEIEEMDYDEDESQINLRKKHDSQLLGYSSHKEPTFFSDLFKFSLYPSNENKSYGMNNTPTSTSNSTITTSSSISCSSRCFYFQYSFLGYTLGLLMTIFFAFFLKIAQPALLYLVPTTLGPVCIYSYRMGHFNSFWNGVELYQLSSSPSSPSSSSSSSLPSSSSSSSSDNTNNTVPSNVVNNSNNINNISINNKMHVSDESHSTIINNNNNNNNNNSNNLTNISNPLIFESDKSV